MSWAWATLTAVNNAAWFAYFFDSRYLVALVPATSATLLATTLAIMLARRGNATPRAIAAVTTWALILLGARLAAGAPGLAVVLTVAFALQVIPSIVTAYRTSRPTGLATTTWYLIFGELFCWGLFGLHQRDPQLIALGVTGVTASLLMIFRARQARPPQRSPSASRSSHRRMPTGTRHERRRLSTR